MTEMVCWTVWSGSQDRNLNFTTYNTCFFSMASSPWHTLDLGTLLLYWFYLIELSVVITLQVGVPRVGEQGVLELFSEFKLPQEPIGEMPILSGPGGVEEASEPRRSLQRGYVSGWQNTSVYSSISPHVPVTSSHMKHKAGAQNVIILWNSCSPPRLATITQVVFPKPKAREAKKQKQQMWLQETRG